jgi:hypothetical protein
VGGDSSVSIATRYRLDGPRIESRWWARLSTPVQTGPAAHPASYTMGTGAFPAVKRQGRGDHPPPSSTKVKERVALYFYSRSGPSWPVIGWNFPFYCTLLSLHLHNSILFLLMYNCFYDMQHNGLSVNYPCNWYYLTLAQDGLKHVAGKLQTISSYSSVKCISWFQYWVCSVKYMVICHSIQ